MAKMSRTTVPRFTHPGASNQLFRAFFTGFDPHAAMRHKYVETTLLKPVKLRNTLKIMCLRSGICVCVNHFSGAAMQRELDANSPQKCASGRSDMVVLRSCGNTGSRTQTCWICLTKGFGFRRAARSPCTSPTHWEAVYRGFVLN